MPTILEPATRAAVGVTALVLFVAAYVAHRLGARRPAAALAAGAMIALGLVAVEQLTRLVAASATDGTVAFNDHRWIVLAPWGRMGLVAGCIAATMTALLSWYATAAIASPWHRGAIIALRTGVAATALVLFVQPALELRQVVHEPNHIAVLVDVSASMALHDTPDAPTREQRARALLDRSAHTLDAWRADHVVDFYTFGSDMTPSTRAAVGSRTPRDRATLLRDALDKTRARYHDRDLAGMIVISDGTATGRFRSGAGDGTSLELLRSLDTIVHTVWAGRAGLKDVAVAKLLVDEFAFVRTVVEIDAVIRATGYERRRIPVSLRRGKQVLRTTWIDVGPGSTTTHVTFALTPSHVGKRVYEISTPIDDDEAVRTNNTRAFVLRVIRDKIRVLQVAGQPSWDVRALRRLLKQNPNVDLISFFILRTHEDLHPVAQAEMSLIPFPTHELFGEQLPSFDLIILQNFNYGPYEIGRYLENIRRYVADGGGLIMVGGPLSFSSGGYAGTPVADALPVELLPNSLPPARLLDSRMFRPRLTRDGKTHPITTLRYADANNTAAWSALVPLAGINLVRGAKRDATVLAVHPTLTTATGDRMPLLVAGSYRRGRALAVMTDSSWRWGFVAAARPGDDGRSYDTLWDNAIRWAIQDPNLRTLHVETDASTYYAGDPIRIDVRLLGRDYKPRAGEVSLEVARADDGAGHPAAARATVTTSTTGQASHQLTGLAAGVYRVEASAKAGGRAVEAQDLFVIRTGSVELDRPEADPTALARIAAVTGGRFLDDVDRLPQDLPLAPPRAVRVDRRANVELWSQPWLLVIALSLLGIEWGLRQWSGTL